MRPAPRVRPWLSVFRWRLFSLLAVIHIAVLPRLLSEREDARVSVVGGLAYGLLAVVDLSLGRRSRLP